jgi:hypothetical protein
VNSEEEYEDTFQEPEYEPEPEQQAPEPIFEYNPDPEEHSHPVNLVPQKIKQIVNENDLINEITEFSEYLDREYEALYPIVIENDVTRNSRRVDQEVQRELERRLDLVDYIRKLFQERIEGLVK